MIRNSLVLLLIAAILGAAIAGPACEQVVAEVATATWLEEEKAVKVEDPRGVSIKVKGLEAEEFEALSATGVVEVEIRAEPRPGDIVLILLDRKCGAEELIILGQYVELRDYVRDLNQLQRDFVDGIIDWLNKLLGFFIPPVGEWLFSSKGLVWGILKVDADKVETLGFVESMRGGSPLRELEEVVQAPFSWAHKSLEGVKEVICVGESEFQVYTLSGTQRNIRVESVAGMPQLVIWQDTTHQVQEIKHEALVAGERQIVVLTTDDRLFRLYHVEGEEEWTLRELELSP